METKNDHSVSVVISALACQELACSRLRDEEKMRKTRGGWGETGRRPVSPQPPRIFPAATTPFPKSRASYFRFARFNTSPLYYLRAWHRLVKNGTENYISQIPETIRITELQKIVLLGTVHTLRRSLSITVIHESYDCPKFME